MHGVLPRPIVSKPRKEYLFDFFEGRFFDFVVFSRKPEKRRLGAICGGLAASCDLILALACHADLGALRPCDVSQLQFAASAVFALEPCFDRVTAFLLGQPRIGVHCPHLAQNASGSSDAGMRRTLFCNSAETSVVFCDTPCRERPVRVTAPIPFGTRRRFLGTDLMMLQCD